MKVIKHLLTYLLGSKDETSFEERLVLSYMLFAGLACLSSVFMNFSLGLGYAATIIVAVSFLFFVSDFILGRYFKKIHLAKILFSVYSLLFCNFYWYANFGSRGSAMYMFLVYFFIMIFAWENLQIWIIGLFVILNIIILFLVEITFPNFLPNYSSDQVRIIDTYGTLVIVLGFFSIIIISAKNNYIKQYKRAQHSDKLKSAFLANMSHEIRTPLNAIIGFTRLMAKKDLSKEKKETYANLVNDNSTYLLKLVSDILDISMIESGQFNLHPKEIELNKLMDKLYQTHLRVISDYEKKGYDFFVDYPSHTVKLYTDEVRLEQVLTNLINNAIKFTVEGYVKFGFEEKPDHIQFFVEDTGRGIKEEFQSEIFSRFVKSDEDINFDFVRGAGIGLALCKELVRLLGGKIWFTSQYQKGTTFYFSIPLLVNTI